MPSVVNNAPGTKGNDSQDFYEKFVAIVEKKIRNVDKRKSRIATLLSQQKEGKVLDADQAAAVSKLPFVESNLETMRELLPQFRSIINDAEKYNKRAQRREELKRLEIEQGRVRGTLSTLHILSLLTQDTKEMLLRGHNGLTLTEAELSMLDQLYRATDTSSVPWSEVDDQLTAASSYIIDLQDGKDKAAFDDVKYSEINELLEKLRTSSFFDPDYVPPIEEKEEEEVEEEEEEEEEEVVLEEEIIEEPPVEEPDEEPEEEVVEEVVEEPQPTEEEEALLNGDVQPPAPPAAEAAVVAEPIVDFMHDSHLDRSESQLSPLAPEFNPSSSPEMSEGDAAEVPTDPDLIVEENVTTDPVNTDTVDPVAATFGTFSQEDNSNNDGVNNDPAVMAWSTGVPAEETTAPEPSATSDPAVEEQESTNPWSKKSTLEWGNTSLPSEPVQTTGQVWGTNAIISGWGTSPGVTHDGDWPAVQTPAPGLPAEVAEPIPVMKDQTTQKVDEDGFTEQRRRGANKQRYNNKPVAGAGGGGFRGGNTGRGGRYNNRRGNDRGERGDRRFEGDRKEGGDKREGGERGNRRGGNNFGGRGGNRGGSGGFRGGDRTNYRGRGRGGTTDRSGRPAPIPT